MQFKYSSSLPVGLKIEPKIKSSAPRRKKVPRKHQTKLKIANKISVHFSSTRKGSWDSLLPPLSATVEHPIHTAGAQVPMIEQHTTTSLAFLSQSAPHGKAEEAAHPTPHKGHPKTLPQTESGFQNSSNSSWMQRHQQGRKNLWEKGGGKKRRHQCS